MKALIFPIIALSLIRPKKTTTALPVITLYIFLPLFFLFFLSFFSFFAVFAVVAALFVCFVCLFIC